MRALATIPLLRTFDEAKTREFYVDFLGFRVDFGHRFGENFPLFLQASRDGCVLWLSEHHGDACPGAHVAFTVTGIAAFHAELCAKQYRYATPGLERTDRGTLDVTVTDPFGNRLTFSEATTPKLWLAPTIVPSLAYGDVFAAAAWLVRVFGFRERADARLRWQDGGMTWLELDDALVNLQSSDAHALRSPARSGGASQGLKVYVADVDAHFRRARDAGAHIISEPADGFWGGRIYRVADLEGHPWEFSQRGVDLPADRWALPPGVRRGGDPDGGAS